MWGGSTRCLPTVSASKLALWLCWLTRKELASRVSVAAEFVKPGADFTSITGKQRKHLNLVGLMWNMTLVVVLEGRVRQR